MTIWHDQEDSSLAYLFWSNFSPNMEIMREGRARNRAIIYNTITHANFLEVMMPRISKF